MMGMWRHLSDIVLAAQLNGASGEGLQYSLQPSWVLPPWLTLVLVAAAAALVVVLYLRERGQARAGMRLLLAAIRLTLLAMVLLMLCGWMLHRDRTDLPDVVVLVDDSQSMGFEDHYEDRRLRARLEDQLSRVGLAGRSRINLAKALLLDHNARLLKQLSEKYNLKIYRIADAARAAAGTGAELAGRVHDWQAERNTSRLGTCLRHVLQLQRGRPTAAVLVLTDGITTEGQSIGEVADYARRKAVPLYIVGLGSDRPPRDVRLGDVLVDDVVFVGDLVSVEARLIATGYAGQQARVQLEDKGSGRVLAQQPVRLGEEGKPQSVRLSFRPEQAGQVELAVRCEPLPGESVTGNNQVVKTISVRDEKIRVLLVQAYPSFEFRYLSTLLSRQRKGQGRAGQEEAIELTVVLQQADEQFAAADPQTRRVFPVQRDELFQYDVIIFGDVDPSGLGRLEMENLADFVKQRGGGVVFIAGPRFTPLAYRGTPLEALMPVQLGSAIAPAPDAVLTKPYHPQPTPLGLATAQMTFGADPQQSRRIWNRLPGFYWLLEAPDLKLAARVLAEDPTRTGSDGRPLPVICMQFVGAGKVIFHATDETYRWRYRIGSKYFGHYWLQTIRYLSRSKLLGQTRIAELTSDFQQYRRGQPVQLRLRFFDERLAPAQDDAVTIVLERQGGKRRYLNLQRHGTSRGVFEGTVTNLAEGDYRLWLARPTLKGQPPALRLSVVAPPGEQARLVMDSADLKRAARISRGRFYTIQTAQRLLDELPRGRQVRIASLPPVPLWTLWPVTLAFGTLFFLLIVTEWLLRKRLGML